MKESTKRLLCDNANYDRENNDSTNALVHAVLNSVMFPQFFLILLYMLDTFCLSIFFPKYYLNELCFELPQNVM